MILVRNIAKEDAIRRAVGKLPGVVVEDIKPQSDYYIVTFLHEGVLRAAKAQCKESAVKAVKEKIA